MRDLKSYFTILLLSTFLTAAVAGLAMADSVDDEVARLNKALAAEGLPWQAGRTSVSEMSPAERKALLGGPDEPMAVGLPTLDVSEEGANSPEPYSGGAPPVASFDWRNRGGINWMTPVTNQCCGDCWAHATMGSMEVRLRWQQGGTYGYQLPIDLSERYTVACYHSGNCSSWSVSSLLSDIQSSGVTDESCLPYDCSSNCTDRCSNWDHRVYKVTSYGTYNGPGATFTDNVANSCYYNGPIAVWMTVYDDFYSYSSGIYVKSAGATAVAGHFVNIVGWGSSGGVDYWICKNSWGTGWGMAGYFFIRRGTNESRIEEQAYWLTPQSLPNLNDSTPTGWDYPIVPRGDATATSGSAHVPSTLPGNSNSTYWNVNWINEGTVEARDNVTHLTVDGSYWYWFSMSYQPSGYETKHLNYGPQQVRGGRHTLCLDEIDFDNRVWEYDESDNWYCRQFVWSPYGLGDNAPVTRSAPPQKDSLGYSWYNTDGFSFLVQAVHPNAWWSAVGTLPSSASADYDVRLYDIGTYTGAQSGFGSYLDWSSYGGSASDFVIVNDNTALNGTYYAGALNYNNGSGDFRIEEDASEKIYPRPGTQWNGPWSKSTTNVLDIYEVYLPAGDYYFLLDQTSGTCDLGMSLYDDETTTAIKGDYMAGGFANAAGDGGDEAFLITIPDAGFHGLVVWKADASDYGKSATYRLAVGPPAITVTAPNGGETLYMGSVAGITWDSFGPISTIGSYVRIQISRDGGGSWSTITSSTYNDGGYSWTVTGPVSTTCRLRITSTTDSSYTDTSDANFTIADNTAPTPNPMTWAAEPYETGLSSISMVATTATDPTGPITYYFLFNGSPTGGTGGTSSGWIASTTYSDTGLSTNHQYGYQVYARDGSYNNTSPSSVSYDYTDIEPSTGITFGAITATSIQARSTNTPSGLTRGSSGLYVRNVTNGMTSGWKQNNNLWTSGGLTPNTSYQFRALARNGDAASTAWSPSSSRYTLANPPVADVFTNVTQTNIRANWVANGNPAGTQYYCQNLTAGTGSGWTTNTYWDSSGLSPGTAYTFQVRARNAEGVVTAWVSLGTQTTLPSANICECNLNGDASCNILDYQIFMQDWGRTNCGTPAGSGNPPNDCECDLNTDGSCNILDYQIFMQDWGRTDCP